MHTGRPGISNFLWDKKNTTFGHDSMPFVQSHFTNTLNFIILRGAF